MNFLTYAQYELMEQLKKARLPLGFIYYDNSLRPRGCEEIHRNPDGTITTSHVSSNILRALARKGLIELIEDGFEEEDKLRIIADHFEPIEISLFKIVSKTKHGLTVERFATSIEALEKVFVPFAKYESIEKVVKVKVIR